MVNKERAMSAHPTRPSPPSPAAARADDSPGRCTDASSAAGSSRLEPTQTPRAAGGGAVSSRREPALTRVAGDSRGRRGEAVSSRRDPAQTPRTAGRGDEASRAAASSGVDAPREKRFLLAVPEQRLLEAI